MQRFGRNLAASLLLLGTALTLDGCAIAGLVSVMGQANEYQKLIEVPPRYDGLRNQKVAVLVDAELDVLYQHPRLIEQVMFNASQRILRFVEGAQVMPVQTVLGWQYQTPQWNAMPYGEIADQLGVDRIVQIDIYEYRLNPPGNKWLWEGLCAADVGIVERDSMDPDSFIETFQVRAEFPNVKGVGRENATQAQIETGVLSQFFQQIGWLFYLHEEPKYPDQYRPGLG
jgi:hypothetical protein